MIHIQEAKPEEFKHIAALVIEKCLDPETHCIQSATGESIEELVGEMQKWHESQEMTWVSAYSGKQLIGTMGCEYEISAGRGWLRGPFALTDFPDISKRLWSALKEQVPSEINRFDAFLNIKNVQGQAFYMAEGFAVKDHAHVYSVIEPDFRNIKRALIRDLPTAPILAAEHESFSTVHDAVFPGTFISGKLLLKKLDDTHRVWVHNENDEVVGYLYGVWEDWSEEGYIEFLGVAEKSRRKGIGGALLLAGLDWFFDSCRVPAVGLTVDDSNTNARALYESVGFRLKYSGVNQRLDRSE